MKGGTVPAGTIEEKRSLGDKTKSISRFLESITCNLRTNISRPTKSFDRPCRDAASKNLDPALRTGLLSDRPYWNGVAFFSASQHFVLGIYLHWSLGDHHRRERSALSSRSCNLAKRFVRLPEFGINFFVFQDRKHTCRHVANVRK